MCNFVFIPPRWCEQKDGGLLDIISSLYFMISILLGAFVFANLIVAVVVTNLVGGGDGIIVGSNRSNQAVFSFVYYLFY